MKQLDLHGTRHGDVRRKVIRFVEDNWGDRDDAEIVTGHSRRMKDLVIDVLDEYGLIYATGTVLVPDAPRIIIWGFE